MDRAVTVELDFEDPIRRIKRRLRTFRHHGRNKVGEGGFGHGELSGALSVVSSFRAKSSSRSCTAASRVSSLTPAFSIRSMSARGLGATKGFTGRREGEERVDRLPIWLLAEKLTCGC
jgi:hypothetical protein